MMRLLYIGSGALLFGLAPRLLGAGALLGSVGLVVLGVLLANAASAHWNLASTAAGAIGALLLGVVSEGWTPAGGGIVLACVLLERTLRVRGIHMQIAHVAMGLVLGVLGMAVTSHFARGDVATRIASAAVAATLAGIPLLVSSADPVVHALRHVGARIKNETGALLSEAADFHELVADVPLDKDVAKGVRKTWASLVRLAEARLAVLRAHGTVPATERAEKVTRMLERKIREHVDVLRRAYSAVEGARAWEVGLDDAALRGVESMGEGLEEATTVLGE